MSNNKTNNSIIMKKYLVIAAAALALAACTKSEVFTPETSAIDFSPKTISTKALVTGTTFPNQTFNVFAFANLEDNEGVRYNAAQIVMNDVEISMINGDWKAAPTAEHPLPWVWTPSGYINFYAYYPSTMTASFDTTANKAQVRAGLQLEAVDLGAQIGSQIDPLVACALNQRAADKPKVSLVFKHITSQIAVYAFDATTIESLRGHIILQEVSFENLKKAGSYVEGETTGLGRWTPVAQYQNFTPYKTTSTVTLPAAKDTISTDPLVTKPVEKYLSEESLFVVIPQTLAATDSAKMCVTYKTTAYTVNGYDYPDSDPQTIEIPLYGGILNGENSLQNGKRYVFHIGITLDKANNEIMFSPSVSDWEAVDVNGITIDAVNCELL